MLRIPRFFWRHKITSVLLIPMLGGVGTFTWLWVSVNLPEVTAPPSQTSFFYDANGNLLSRLPSAEDRRVVKLAEISKAMQRATIAAEDRSFYSHSAIDPRGTARALWRDIRGRELAEGGSTITQQLVKNLYTGGERSLVRKAREAVLAIKLEQQKSKDEILEGYLNIVYFGRGAYGVEAAALTYFGKRAKDLGWPEAALLAGLIRAPSAGDPLEDEGAAKYERSRVLDALVITKDLTAAEAAAHTAAPLGVQRWDRSGIEATGGTAYFLEWVRQVLEEKYGRRLYTGGFKIYTTIDPKLQAEAERVIAETLTDPEDPSASIVAIDRDGNIRAMVGGKDFAKSQVNLALGQLGGGSGRHSGSTFKAFTLAAAVERGISIDTFLPGSSPRDIVFGDETAKVQNYGNSQFGSLSIVDATISSVNVAYAALAATVGVRRVVDEAHKLGITSELGTAPSVILGGKEVSVLEMARAYCTFATRGLRVDYRPVTKIVGPDGKVVEEIAPRHTRVMEPNDADIVNWVLRQVVTRGTGGSAGIGRQVAGKTGTTDENTDAWFVGYTPDQMCTAVWMGYPAGRIPMDNVHGIEVTGGSFPAQMWGAFMAKATEKLPASSFHYPDFRGAVVRVDGGVPRRTAPIAAIAAEEAPEDTTTSSVAPTASTAPQVALPQVVVTTQPPPTTTSPATAPRPVETVPTTVVAPPPPSPPPVPPPPPPDPIVTSPPETKPDDSPPTTQCFVVICSG